MSSSQDLYGRTAQEVQLETKK